jgi:ApaG protein
MYRAETHKIEVTAEPIYLADQSAPQQGRWFWAYTITITNHSAETVQLISRHWRITDGKGRLHEVRGEGVIGEQPLIEPGGSFSYTSGCPLETPEGIMVGDYAMVKPDGEMISVAIPAFSLDSQTTKRVLH